MESVNTSDVNQLLKLLSIQRDDNSGDEDCEYGMSGSFHSPHSTACSITPADCVVENKLCDIKDRPNYYEERKKSKDIWSDDEILDESYDESRMKETPLYEVSYQQNVTPDDIFLQLDGKGPGSNSCEGLVLKIKLEETNSKDKIELKVSEESLKCNTEKYYLNFDFPKKVDPRLSCAKWDQTDYTLEVMVTFDEKKVLDF